jgi:hypothetical protein
MTRTTQSRRRGLVGRAGVVLAGLVLLLAPTSCGGNAPPTSPGPSATTSPSGAEYLVTTYGATGDGSQDDTQAVADACRAASPGDTVVFPAGVFRVTALTLPNGISLRGAGAGATWLKGEVTAGSDLRISKLKVGLDGVAFKFTEGAARTVFEGVTFTGGGPMSEDGCVIQMVGRGGSYITFRNCTIGANPYDGNGVSMTPTGWSGGNYHDIVWENCHFLGSPRMNFECTERYDGHPMTVGYSNINLIDCVFEPSGSECISYDADADAGDSTISGCTIKGAGWNERYPWGQGVEFNAVKGMRFLNNTVYRCRGAMVNHTGLGPDVPCDIVYKGNTFDRTVSYIPTAVEPGTEFIYLDGVSGVQFSDNVARSNVGGMLLYLSGSPRNTFTGNSWTDTRPASTAAPCIFARMSSSGNLWDGELFDSAGLTTGLCIFRSGSTDNTIRNSTFVTHGSVPVSTEADIAITLENNQTLP